MIPPAIGTTLLASDPDEAQVQLEELAAKDAGRQLRAVAVDLVSRGLQVATVGYLGGWTEPEATLPRALHLGPVTMDRDAAGTTCQLAWGCWADITTPGGAGQVAGAAVVLLRGMAACPSLAPPSALTPNRAPAATPGPGQAAGIS